MVITNYSVYERELVDCGSVTCETYKEFLDYYRSMSAIFKKGEKYKAAQKNAGKLWRLVKERKKERLENYQPALNAITHTNPSFITVLLNTVSNYLQKVPRFSCKRKA